MVNVKERGSISNANENKSHRKNHIAFPIATLAIRWTPWQQIYDHFLIIPTTPQQPNISQALRLSAPQYVFVDEKAKIIGVCTI